MKNLQGKLGNKKGFTLAELLIVVAIIAVLAAVAIPLFSTQLERAREATDIANIRSSYAEAMTEYMTNGNKEATIEKYAVKQTRNGWQTNPIDWSGVGGTGPDAKTSGTWKVTITPDADGNDPTIAIE